MFADECEKTADVLCKGRFSQSDEESGARPMSAGFWRLSASQLLAGYARGDFSPVEVLNECLERIERLNPSLRAYLAVNSADARTAAFQTERAWRSGATPSLLCGVPVSIKDTIEMHGLPTTYGSLAFKDNYQDDSEIVRRLRRAGAVMLGKTNTPEFALLPSVQNRLGAPGCNPWNLTRSCGGSSGGAAAAVAAGLGPLAVGTDSGGSIRQPAAYNGVFGFKPTYQRIPTVQRWRAAPGRSHNGVLARTVRDGALLFQALAGPHARDPDSNLEANPGFVDLKPPPGTRVHLICSVDGIAAGEAGELKGIGELLERWGCEVDEGTLPPVPRDVEELESGIWGYAGDHYAAAESLLPGFWEKHAKDLTDYARPIYDAGRKALAWHYRRLLQRTQTYRDSINTWVNSFDFVLTPAEGPAPLIESTTSSSGVRFFAPFNIARNPAAVVPTGVQSDGLPRAIQIVGRVGDDVGVLRMAAVIEDSRGQIELWPPHC